jgi:hypothetical protein
MPTIHNFHAFSALDCSYSNICNFSQDVSPSYPTVYPSCLQYIMFMLFQRYIALTVIYVILLKMTVHHILLYLPCLQYMMFMLFQRYIALTVIYVILLKISYCICHAYTIHNVHALCQRYIAFIVIYVIFPRWPSTYPTVSVMPIQYIMFMLCQRYIAFTVIYVIFPRWPSTYPTL